MGETRRIVTYWLNLEVGRRTVPMPPVCDILSVGARGDFIGLWAMSVDDGEQCCDRVFEVVATGDEVARPEELRHIGMVRASGAAWHVFERIGALDPSPKAKPAASDDNADVARYRAALTSAVEAMEVMCRLPLGTEPWWRFQVATMAARAALDGGSQ